MAFNAIDEHLDHGRRYTARTTQCSLTGPRSSVHLV
jgi:hypothetical protein